MEPLINEKDGAIWHYRKYVLLKVQNIVCNPGKQLKYTLSAFDGRWGPIKAYFYFENVFKNVVQFIKKSCGMSRCDLLGVRSQTTRGDLASSIWRRRTVTNYLKLLKLKHLAHACSEKNTVLAENSSDIWCPHSREGKLMYVYKYRLCD